MRRYGHPVLTLPTLYTGPEFVEFSRSLPNENQMPHRNLQFNIIERLLAASDAVCCGLSEDVFAIGLRNADFFC